MAQFIEFQVEASGTPLAEGPYLIPVANIISASEATLGGTSRQLTIIMGSQGGANYNVVVSVSTVATGATPVAGTIPVTTAGRPLVEALQYAQSANPGGVKAHFSPGWDQNVAAGVNNGNKQKIYVNTVL